MPDAIRSEKYTEDDFNEIVMGALTDFVQNTYGGRKPGTYGADYKAINDYFQQGNVVSGGGSKFSDVGALKTVLGAFDVGVSLTVLIQSLIHTTSTKQMSLVIRWRGKRLWVMCLAG